MTKIAQYFRGVCCNLKVIGVAAMGVLLGSTSESPHNYGLLELQPEPWDIFLGDIELQPEA